MSFINVMNDFDGDRGASGNGNTQASGSLVSYGGTTETRHCFYCKKSGNLKPDCLKFKVKRAFKEAENVTRGGTSKIDEVEDSVDKHAHTMLDDGFRDFKTRAEDHFFFSQVMETENFSNIPPSCFLLDIKITIDIISKK